MENAKKKSTSEIERKNEEEKKKQSKDIKFLPDADIVPRSLA